MATSVTRHAITWTFDTDYTTGTFVNGDPWVVENTPGGGVRVNSISPTSTISGDWTTNGSMVNPSSGSVQGFDSQMNFISYDPSLNVGRPGGNALSTSNPLLLSAGSSLISTKSAGAPGALPQLTDASVLTVLASAPASGAFRPPYCGGKVMYNTSQVDLSFLLALPTVGSMPSEATALTYIERPWIDFINYWMARYIHPANNMPNYGREMVSRVGVVAAMMHLNISAGTKQTLAYQMIQLGIDLYGVTQIGVGWTADGGHSSGRKYPIVFAGVALGIPSMQNIGSSVPFGEDEQTFYVTQTEVDFCATGAWAPDTRNGPASPYTTAMIDMPEWGIRHGNTPSFDNANWTANYRQCCTATAWGAMTTALILGEMQDAWNHPAFFDYVERFMAITDGNSDPFGYVVPDEESGWRSIVTQFDADMYDTYSNYLSGDTLRKAMSGGLSLSGAAELSRIGKWRRPRYLYRS